MNFSTCPNCNAEIKSSTFSKVSMKSPLETEFINKYSDQLKPGYCSKCSSVLFANVGIRFRNDKEKIQKSIDSLIRYIPVITVFSPHKWEYSIVEMVSAQYVIGTGIIAEIGSGITDIFGMKSNIYSKKVRDGENFCKNIIRYEALTMGGNAVIGTDIDFSEAGGAKGMLMVCMSGTAIKLHNTDILLNGIEEISKLKLLSDELESLKKYDIISL